MPDLSDGVNWSEVDANNNQPPPNGWPEGMMPSGVNDAARADKGALKRFWDKINPVQSITPSGGIYTFTTASPAYPAAYVDGEIYCFHPNTQSVGGDQFQVNSLAPKPIFKRVAPNIGMAPIIAQDIQPTGHALLIYRPLLNAGNGAFLLLNPFVPIYGDGSGGVSVPGALTVAGNFAVAGNFTANGGMVVGGNVNAFGYASRSGLSGPYQTNLFNVQWDGSAAHLWIDTSDQGPIVTAPGGNITISGALTAAGPITANAATIIGGQIIDGNLSVGGLTTMGTPGLIVHGNVLIDTQLTVQVVDITNQLNFSGQVVLSSTSPPAGARYLYMYP